MSPAAAQQAALLAAKRAALDALRAERQALADLLGPHEPEPNEPGSGEDSSTGKR